MSTQNAVNHNGCICRMCHSGEARDLGRIVHFRPENVAGIPIDLTGIEFRLLQCDACGFQFKHPPIDEARLLECYARASSAHWEMNPDPCQRQFDVLLETVQGHARGRRILDVGCFNGALLEYFGPKWERFGIEPSSLAAEEAGRRGVRIVGKTLHDVSQSNEKFDVVIMIDVIEHLAQPFESLRNAATLLNPEGIVVIFTGNTQARSWRMLGSRYWYCSMPEHVSFFCPRTLDDVARRLKLQTVSCSTMSHVRSGVWRRSRKAIRNVLFAGAIQSRGFGVPNAKRWLENRVAPMWLTACDHLLYVMRAS